MKIKQILIFILFSIFLANSVSAASIGYLGWQDSQGNYPYPPITQLTVNQGGDAYFHVYAYAYDDPFDVQIWLKQGTMYLAEIDYIQNINNPNGMASFSNSYNLDTSSLNGNYQIEVSANGQSFFDIKTISLTVNPSSPNHAPTISLISPTNGAQNLNIPVTLTWNGEDQDGDLLHYTIYLNNNIVSSCNNIIEESCLLTNLEYGTSYNWKVSVTDGIETVQSSTWTFTTQSLFQNNPPVANIISPIGTQTINVGTSINFIGEGTDPDGDDIIAYSWDFNNDNIEDSNQASAAYTFNQAGTYTVNFKVKDEHSLWSQPDTLTVIVNPLINHAPEVTVIYPNGGETLSGTATIQYSAIDVDNDVLSIEIEISSNNGGSWTFVADNLVNTGSYQLNTNNYQNGNQYLIKVTASDSQLSDSDTSDNVFTIDNQPGQNIIPTAFIDTPQNNQEFFAGTSIIFSGHGVDQDGQITAYSWDFNNDNIEDSNQASTTYIFNQVGTYTLNFKVKDDQNAWSELEYVTIIINPELPEENTPPVLTILHPINREWVEGYYNIEWVATDAEQLSSTLNIKIQYKRIDITPIKIVNQIIYPLTGWVTLENSQNNDGNYGWNTNNIDNGEYILKITATDDEGESIEEEVEFEIDNPILLNNEPQVLGIAGYTNPDSGIINFVVDTYDQDGDDITQIDFQIYYTNSWHVIECTENSPNEWICVFDSTTIIEYDNNVQAKAKVYDGEDWGDYYYTSIFTIDNIQPQPPEEPEAVERHKFAIVNVIPKIKLNNIELYVNIKSKGNQDEDDITIKATVVQTGLTVYDNIDMGIHDGLWRTIQLPKLNSGIYVVNVEAYNDEYRDNRLIALKI